MCKCVCVVVVVKASELGVCVRACVRVCVCVCEWYAPLGVCVRVSEAQRELESESACKI